jgi:hypothetical protein
VRLAKALEEDPDVLLALAGKVSQDLQRVVRKQSKLFDAAMIDRLHRAPVGRSGSSRAACAQKISSVAKAAESPGKRRTSQNEGKILLTGQSS